LLAIRFRRNRSCSASDSAHCYTFLRSVVCLSVCCLSHLCSVLKWFNGFRHHLAGTLVGFDDTLVVFFIRLISLVRQMSHCSRHTRHS